MVVIVRSQMLSSPLTDPKKPGKKTTRWRGNQWRNQKERYDCTKVFNLPMIVERSVWTLYVTRAQDHAHSAITLILKGSAHNWLSLHFKILLVIRHTLIGCHDLPSVLTWLCLYWYFPFIIYVRTCSHFVLIFIDSVYCVTQQADRNTGGLIVRQWRRFTTQFSYTFNISPEAHPRVQCSRVNR